MKKTLLRIIMKCSKLVFYGLIIQTCFMGVLMAHEGSAQKNEREKIKSVRETTISLSLQQASIEEVFQTIETNSEYRFFYNRVNLDKNLRLNVSANDVLISDILLQISNQASLKFKQVNEIINVSPLNKKNGGVLVVEISQERTITGQVTSEETPEGLPGVNVILKGTTTGTVTDVNGDYSIDVSSEDAVLVFSSVGFIQQEVRVGSQSVVNVSMLVDVSSLDEVVVVGYGSQNKAELTSSISSIAPDEIKEMPVVGVDQQIQGRAAGVVVVNNTGEPGGGITMRIRGTSSIGSGNEPLFVIDGMPIENTQTANRNVGNARINGLSQVNPSDIESIEILKDAAATAIYGARASNGVVLITTKRGAEGVSEFSIDAYAGVSQLTSRYDILGASDFAVLNNEGRAQIGEDPIYTQDFINNPTIDTDWQDEIFRTANVYSMNINARGGNKTTGYMVSGGYLNQEGTIIDSKFERYSMRANIDHRINNFIKLGANFYGAFIDQDRVRNDGGPDAGDASHYSHIYGPPVLSTALVKNPASPVYDENGDYYVDTLALNYVNPVRQAKDIDIDFQATRLMPSLFLNISLTKNLMLTSRFSADIRNENEEWWNPPAPNLPVGTDGTGQTSRRTYDKLMWTLDNYFTYDLDLGEGSNFSVLVGNSLQKSSTESSFVLAASIESPFIRTLNAGVDYDVVESNKEAWSLASFFGRINYDYKNKYLLNVNARYDGSSRFGENNRFGFFPSAAVGWNISREDFMSSVSSVQELKIRVSYGLTGNQAIGNYASRALMNVGTGTNIGNNYTGKTGAKFQNLASDDLSWEETAQLNIGLDGSILKNRLSVAVDYYIKTTDDLLFNVPLPRQTGFSNIVGNSGKMENRGIEFTLNSTNISTQDFQWTTSFNISRNKNKILELLDDEDVIVGSNTTGYSIARVGESISFYTYQREKLVNPEDGTVTLIDQNNDEVINTDDLVITGNPFPDFFGGLRNFFTYKNFDLDIFFQYSYGNDIYNLTRRTLEIMNVPNEGIITGNTTQKAFDNRWQNPGDVTEYPKVNFDQTNNNFNQAHDGWIEDGSYMRLKTLTVGYNFNSTLLERLSMSRARIYFSANNILTFTNYSGFDPEVDHYQGVFGGANSGLRKGYDYGDYPQAKTYVVGINVTF